MVKIQTLADITTNYAATSTINGNNDKIESAFDNTLSRDGSEPNYMSANLDMNSKRVINISDPVDNQDAVSKAYVDALAFGVPLPPPPPPPPSPTINAFAINLLDYIPDNLIDSVINGTNTTDLTSYYNDALAGVSNINQDILVPQGTYLFKQAITLGGGASTGHRLIGQGRPVFKFSSDLSSNTDCFTATGYNYNPIVVKNILFDAETYGRDLFSLASSDHPDIDVVLTSAGRDAFQISQSGTQFVENGNFNLWIVDAGRHGIHLSLSGSGGAFFNESVFNHVEIRGISRRYNLGRAVYAESTASLGSSTMSNIQWRKGNFDCIYNTAASFTPSTNVFETNGGIYGNWSIFDVTAENTGSGTITGGVFVANGGGATMDIEIHGGFHNSGWGDTPGIATGVGHVYAIDHSFSYTQLPYYVVKPDTALCLGRLTTSTGNQTGDGTVYSLTGLTEEFDYGSNLNASTGVFTVPVTGVYRVNAGFSFGPVGGAHTTAGINIHTSTADYSVATGMNPQQGKDGSNNNSIHGSRLIKLNSGDTAIAQFSVAGSTKTVGLFNANSSYFSVELVG